MGRTKGSKNTVGHKAGGKRAGSGRKPRHPRNSVHLSPNRSTAVLDEATPTETSLGNGTAGPSDETLKPAESQNEGLVQGTNDAEDVNNQGENSAPQPDTSPQVVKLDDVHPDLRQLVQAGRSLPHDIPIVSFLYQGTAIPPVPLNGRAMTAMLAQMQVISSASVQPPAPQGVAASAPSQVEQQHFRLQGSSPENSSTSSQGTSPPHEDAGSPTTTQAASTPTNVEGGNGLVNFNLFALPPASLVAQLPATPDETAPGGKRKRRRCVVCLEEGEHARAYLCPGRGNRAACPLAKARLAKNSSGEATGSSSSTSAARTNSSGTPLQNFTPPLAMAQLLSAGLLGQTIPLLSAANLNGNGSPVWGFHKNGTARVRRPRRCRICVGRGLDGTLCLGRQTKEKCPFYVKESAEEAASSDNGDTGMDEGYEEEEHLDVGAGSHSASTSTNT
ncbi:hypothetical protein FRC03_011454 [Tulasnella sp. 419]|nr:hypothetical protein FRC03_011454 [Tulasnella sp. 419]